MQSKDTLLQLIRDHSPMTARQQLLLTAYLSVPAMLAQLTSIAMQYIDAAMVGSLGADASASVGLVSTSLWLFGGICSAAVMGFSVQVAHFIGARDNARARRVLRQSLVACTVFGLALLLLGVGIARPLPRWLGGSEAINPAATTYFAIFMCGMPLLVVDMLASGMLRSSGNMKIPSILSVLMCVLDVLFNFMLIFPTRPLSVLGVTFTMPGAGLGVTGAAIGTLLAEAVVTALMLAYLLRRSPELRLSQDAEQNFTPDAATITRAVRISLPMALQHIVMCSAQIYITAIVAPLGSVAIAANAFGVTAESLCYMPGYGIADAATTLVGQSIGAQRRRLARHFAFITVLLAMAVMTLMGILLYVGAPFMMGILSPVDAIVDLGAQCLRIEAFAEPLFGAAIVCYAVFVGAGDTVAPCVMNLASMWGVRITLSVLLVGSMGLAGVWTAMCIELCFRGLIFLARLFTNRWMKTSLAQRE